MTSFSNMVTGATPLVIAHRGASAYARENTLKAFELAIEQGSDAVECDVRRTADGVPVVHHDAGITGDAQLIADKNLTDAQVAARRAGFELPTLQQVAQLCAGRVALDVELKEPGYESDVTGIVLEHLASDQVIFKSFVDSAVGVCKAAAPDSRCGLLIDIPRALNLSPPLSERTVGQRLAACRADFVAPHWSLMRLGFARRLHRIGLPIVVWTIDRPALARLMCRKQIAAIVTNCPDRIRRVLGDHRHP